MYTRLVSVFLVIILVQEAEFTFPKWYPKLKCNNIKYSVSETEEPLFLTPLIEQNKIEEARHLAEVPSAIFKNVQSYSGYLTVNKKFDSNIFFWFFPAQEDFENAPVVVWLQGGPGATSIFAIFAENGPFSLKSATQLELNPFSWTNNHSVIYIDNPVGTGYSFTNGGYAQNETKVGDDLYQALKQFFFLFPELQKNEFFITGESYGGKYVPAASYAILKKNEENEFKINLKGMAIGNGLCDPEHQLKYGDYLYQLGLVDTTEKEEIDNKTQEIINTIHVGDFHRGFELFDDLLNGDLNGGNTVFKNITGFNYYFNYLYSNNPSDLEINLGDFIQSPNVRKALHVGNLTFNDGVIVEENLVDDLLQSVAPWITELLSNIRVLFYNGQLDIIVAYPLTINFLKNLNFSSAEEYKTAVRHKWYEAEELAGYIKQAGNLTEVLVRNSGHMVPTDQPQNALSLITKFTRNQLIFN